MADDIFTSEVEWLLRVRRERTSLHRLAIRAIRARRHVLETSSTQGQRDVRRWATPEAEELYDPLDRLVDFLGTSGGKYIDGEVAKPCLPHRTLNF